MGGEEPPIGYKWFFNDDSWSIDISYSPIQTLNTDLPGTYYCKAVDGKGNVAISPSVQVEYTGDVPIITRQPQDLLLSYTQSGECSGELSCLALSGSPKNIYYTPISYTWERKGESGWLYNREQGPTIHVTEPGIYRCICRDTYSGLATVSNEVTVGVKLAYQKATIARTGGWGGRWVFYFTGGTGPFKVTTYWVRHCDIPGVDRVTEKVGTIDRESVSTLTIDMDRVIVPAGITDINGKYHKYEYVALYVVVRDSAGQKANSPVILMRN